MIAIVCGGRNYPRADRVAQVLDAAVERMGLWCIIQGDATGADALAKEWAMSRPSISMISVPADWDIGNSAGPIRNNRMLRILLGHDGDKAVIGFPGGFGTAGMLKLARSPDAVSGGVRVIEIDR